MESQNCCKIISIEYQRGGDERSSYLVDHHNCKKVTNGSKNETIHVVSDSFADGLAECINEDLTNNEEEDAKGNVAQGPSVLECSNNEQDLHDNIYGEEDGAEDV